MKEVKHYVCEICGTEYREKNECEKCEKGHCVAVKIDSQRHISRRNNLKGYPVSIDVKMSNGDVVTYKR